ncbi:MAG: SH3 domain-containing protein [Microcoleus sp. SIO2G3]|nr:SH3 domain-containing protein [Microcoleus sp. SIO2G3]
MKQLNGWQQSIAVSPLVSLAVTAFATPSTAVKPTSQSIKPSPPEAMSLQNQGKFLLAQNSDNCRRVVTRGDNLYVRSSPGGAIIGSLRNKTLVTIEGRSVNGWVQISSPTRGYIAAAYLKLCATPVPPSNSTSNYRRVVVNSSLRVRQEPSINSAIIGSLANGQRVTIVNRGVNGWVPISSPMKGYISSAYLKLR